MKGQQTHLLVWSNRQPTLCKKRFRPHHLAWSFSDNLIETFLFYRHRGRVLYRGKLCFWRVVEWEVNCSPLQARHHHRWWKCEILKSFKAAHAASSALKTVDGILTKIFGFDIWNASTPYSQPFHKHRRTQRMDEKSYFMLNQGIPFSALIWFEHELPRVWLLRFCFALLLLWLQPAVRSARDVESDRLCFSTKTSYPQTRRGKYASYKVHLTLASTGLADAKQRGK